MGTPAARPGFNDGGTAGATGGMNVPMRAQVQSAAESRCAAHIEVLVLNMFDIFT